MYNDNNIPDDNNCLQMIGDRKNKIIRYRNGYFSENGFQKELNDELKIEIYESANDRTANEIYSEFLRILEDPDPHLMMAFMFGVMATTCIVLSEELEASGIKTPVIHFLGSPSSYKSIIAEEISIFKISGEIAKIGIFESSKKLENYISDISNCIVIMDDVMKTYSSSVKEKVQRNIEIFGRKFYNEIKGSTLIITSEKDTRVKLGSSLKERMFSLDLDPLSESIKSRRFFRDTFVKNFFKDSMLAYIPYLLRNINNGNISKDIIKEGFRNFDEENIELGLSMRQSSNAFCFQYACDLFFKSIKDTLSNAASQVENIAEYVANFLKESMISEKYRSMDDDSRIEEWLKALCRSPGLFVKVPEKDMAVCSRYTPNDFLPDSSICRYKGEKILKQNRLTKDEAREAFSSFSYESEQDKERLLNTCDRVNSCKANSVLFDEGCDKNSIVNSLYNISDMCFWDDNTSRMIGGILIERFCDIPFSVNERESKDIHLLIIKANTFIEIMNYEQEIYCQKHGVPFTSYHPTVITRALDRKGYLLSKRRENGEKNRMFDYPFREKVYFIQLTDQMFKDLNERIFKFKLNKKKINSPSLWLDAYQKLKKMHGFTFSLMRKNLHIIEAKRSFPRIE